MRAAAAYLARLLDVVVVAFRLLNDQVAPVDAEKPSNKVDGGQELIKPNTELLFIHILVADTRAKHGARSWENDVQRTTDVRPYVAHLRNLSDELPDA